MNCHETERLISLELDGRLPDHEQQALLQHVNQCLPCASQRALQRRISRALQPGASPAMPAGTVDRVTAAVLRQQRVPRLIRLPLLRIAAALLVSFVLGGLGGVWINASTTEARAGAAGSELQLDREAAAWKALGADEATCAKILSIRRSQQLRSATASPAELTRLETESNAEVLRLLPAAVAKAWREACGLSEAAFQELARRRGH